VKALESNAPIYDLRSIINTKYGRKISIKLNAAVLHDANREPVGGVVSFKKYDFNNEIEEIEKFYGIVGSSKVMKDIYNLVNEISISDAAVLIEGETGTGKELIANAIQATSCRKNKCFLKVNCSAIPPNLLASELFGHARGSFTDADKDRVGRFEMADKGTIFLDEIAEMPLSMQTQILRVLQEGTFERVGESFTRQVNVRVIAATNKNIKNAILEGKFREDLYYRLSVIPFQVPPLRKRLDDLPLLVKHFIQKFNPIYNKNICGLDHDVLEVLMHYNYPGNIRELENIIEYSFLRTKKDSSICRCSLPCYIKNQANIDRKLFRTERQINADELLQLLREYKWNKTKVAELLNVNRTTLWRHLKDFGIE
jgi:transcriptional regulator with PAS, ATPase and Fis domain